MNTIEILSIDSFKNILVIIVATLAIIVNSINLYTGNRKPGIYALLYLGILFYYLFILYRKLIQGLILD
jgi:hypothetical protein